MIDWNKRNGGFLSPESVYEDQLGNLSMQINQKDKEIEKLNEELGDANYTITQLHKVMDRHYVKKEDYDRLNNIIEELEKDLWKIRQLTFSKYNSNEWNNCLSFNDDILPIIKRIKEFKEGKE